MRLGQSDNVGADETPCWPDDDVEFAASIAVAPCLTGAPKAIFCDSKGILVEASVDHVMFHLLPGFLS